MHKSVFFLGEYPGPKLLGLRGCICLFLVNDANFPKWLCKFVFQQAIFLELNKMILKLPAFSLYILDVSPLGGYVLQIFSPTLWLGSSVF